MNKSSRILWFLVLAQASAVVLAIGLRIGHESELRPNRFFTLMPVLPIIPLACGICTAAKRFSPRTRDFFDRNHTAYFTWLMISLIAILMFLSALAPEVTG